MGHTRRAGSGRIGDCPLAQSSTRDRWRDHRRDVRVCLCRTEACQRGGTVVRTGPGERDRQRQDRRSLVRQPQHRRKPDRRQRALEQHRYCHARGQPRKRVRERRPSPILGLELERANVLRQERRERNQQGDGYVRNIDQGLGDRLYPRVCRRRQDQSAGRDDRSHRHFERDEFRLAHDNGQRRPPLRRRCVNGYRDPGRPRMDHPIHRFREPYAGPTGDGSGTVFGLRHPERHRLGDATRGLPARHPRLRHQRTDRPDRSDRNRRFDHPDQPQLGGLDRQCRRDRIPGVPQRDAGWNPGHDGLPGHRVGARDHLHVHRQCT